MESFYPELLYNFSPILLAATTQGLVLLGFIIIILLVLSFFVSGAEVAFFSLSYKDINLLKSKQDAGWKRIVDLLEEPRQLLASLIVANSMVNIAIIILTNVMIDQVMIFRPEYWWAALIIKVIIISALIVLFGEILPKVRATQNNLRFAYESSYVVEIINYVFGRLAARLVSMSDSVERSFGGKSSKAIAQQQLEEAIRSTVQQEDEQRMLAGIYKFGDITVKQVMRTRLDVNGVDVRISFGELKKKISELHYSRLPVYRQSLDEIVGVVHTKDVLIYLNEEDDFNWHGLIRNPFFVHQQKFIEDLLKEFQARRIHIAIVVDEFGGTSGIVTMEDILEEVIGEISDEFDEEETGNKKLEDGTYLFEGRTMINDVCRIMNLSPATFDALRGDSDSLAGLILEVSGKIPAINEVIVMGDFEFTVLDVERNRIRKVKVAIKPQ